MKKGDTVWCKYTDSHTPQMKRGSKHTIKTVHKDGTISLERWIGGPFNKHNFTTTPPQTSIHYHW